MNTKSKFNGFVGELCGGAAAFGIVTFWTAGIFAAIEAVQLGPNATDEELMAALLVPANFSVAGLALTVISVAICLVIHRNK